MKYHSDTSNIDRRLFSILLTPSWLSGTTTVIASLTVIVATIVNAFYRGSNVELDLFNYRAGQTTGAFEATHNSLLTNSFIANLPLLFFWSLVGLVVYLFAANIFRALASTAELRSELGYMHANRHDLLWRAAEHLLLRLMVLIGWTAYIVFFFRSVLPYCVAATLAGTAQLSTLLGGGYILLSIAVMIVALHLQVVLLRLLLLRPRIFSSALYVD